MRTTGFQPRHELLVCVLGAICVIGLLVAFEFEVREGIHLGEASRRADALFVEATWRCKTLRSSAQREDCLQRYGQELPDSSLGVQALVRDVATETPRTDNPR